MGSTTRGQEPGELGGGEQEAGEQERSESEPTPHSAAGEPTPHSAAGEELVRPLPRPPDLAPFPADRIPESTSGRNPTLRNALMREIKNERFILMAERGHRSRRWGFEMRLAVLWVGAVVASIFVISAWQLLESGLPRIGGELKIGSWITLLVGLTSTAYVLYYLGGAAIGISRANNYSRRLSRILSEVEAFEEEAFQDAASYADKKNIPLAVSYDVMRSREHLLSLIRDTDLLKR